MNDNWINSCITEYYKWLKDNTLVHKNEQTGWYIIHTPFLGLFNDNIEIYAKRNNDKILFSDDGQTLSNLELTGVPIQRSEKRKEWLDMILLNYGITRNNNELQTEGSEKEFNQKKHNLLCAIIEISEMEVLAKHTVSSLFKEDVKGFFNEQNFIYTPQFIAKGSTGIEFIFDFQMAGRDSELVIKSFNSLNKMNVPAFLYSWGDIKTGRERVSGKNLKSLAIINDFEKEIKSEYTDALINEGTDIVLWTQRHQPENINKFRLAA